LSFKPVSGQVCVYPLKRVRILTKAALVRKGNFLTLHRLQKKTATHQFLLTKQAADAAFLFNLALCY